MDEDLHTWKTHFNIGDAAYLTLQSILVRRGLPSEHARRGPRGEQSFLRETLCPDELVSEDWLTATTPAGCQFSASLGIEGLPPTDVSEDFSSLTGPPWNRLQALPGEL
jgi:hypothetical protein